MRQVGRLVDRVEELGQTDNTIVIFHGIYAGPAHSFCSTEIYTFLDSWDLY